MFKLGYYDETNKEWVTMGIGVSIAHALCDCATALLDDQLVRDPAVAMQVVQGMLTDMDVPLQILYVADTVQKDGIALYLQG